MKTKLLIITLMLCLNVKAQNLDWAKSFYGTSGSCPTIKSCESIGYDVISDSKKNIYTTGYFSQTVDFDPSNNVFNLTSEPGIYNAFINKLDSAGNFIWSKRIGLAGEIPLPPASFNVDVFGRALAIDSQDNIYVAGSFSGNVDFNPNEGSYVLSSNTKKGFILKLSKDGEFEFASMFTGSCFGITISTDGSIYSTGESTINKFDISGNLLWSKQINGAQGFSIKVAGNGNIISTGYFNGSININQNSITSSGQGINRDAFILNLDSNGNVLWLNQIGGVFEQSGVSLAIDIEDNIFVCGNFYDTAWFGAVSGTDNLISKGNRDIFILKIDSYGNKLWNKSIGGINAEAKSIKIDKDGDIYLGGKYSVEIDVDPGPGFFLLKTTTAPASFIVRFNSDWTVYGAKSFSGLNECLIESIDVDNKKNIQAVGGFLAQVDFDPSPNEFLLNASHFYGYTDIFLFKLSDCIEKSSYSISDSSNTGSYEFEGNNFTQSGTYYLTLQNAFGCDSIISLNLNICSPTSSIKEITECGSYTWNGNTYTQSGTYTWSGINAGGCDSTATMNLTIFENTESTIEVNACGPYEWNGVVYSKSGAYTHLNSCASQTLLLYINEITELNAQINSGETYDFNGIAYSEIGVYYDTIPRVANCDSIVRLNLYVNSLINCEISSSVESICANEQFNLNIKNSDIKVYAIKRDAFVGGDEISEFGIVNGNNLSGFAGIIWGTNRNVNFSNYIGFAPESWRVEQNSNYYKFSASINYSGLVNGEIYFYKTFYINESDTIFSENTHELFFSDSIFNSMLQYGVISDVENNKYKTISIGSQTWMAQNLKAESYSNGDPLTVEIYNGVKIYTPYHVNDSRNVCPIGWRVPNNSDWNNLFKFASSRLGVLQSYYQFDSILTWNDWSGTENVPNITQGALLTSSNEYYDFTYSGWKNQFTNATGFSSVPGEDNLQANYWSSTKIVGSPNEYPRLYASLLSPGEFRIWNDYGRSIRCISNDTIKESQFPVINATQISEVNSTAATITAVIENLNGSELFEKGLIISTYTSEWGSISGLTLGFLKEIDETPFPLIDNYKIVKMGAVPEDFSVDLDNLIPNMRYYVRAYVKNKYGVRYGEELNFTTSSHVNQVLWSTGETTPTISVSPTATTTYSVTVTQGTQTCTSDVTITVKQPSAKTETVSACESYTWKGNTYTQSGTYTWTGANAAGCDSVVTLNLTITPQPVQPETACYQTATFNAQTCSWVLTGTQPTQPATACYETATFNNQSCSWVVTGTQPAQPATACYQTATFNTVSCSWVLTGSPAPAIVTNASSCESYTWEANGQTYTASGNYSFSSNCQDYTLNLTISPQPPQPTTACYQTATFNTRTCSWDVTGTQPIQPATACYQTATFNTQSCSWNVTGTQPIQPPTACYETATFNVQTCSWNVTGTQPVQPPTACYETATFNTQTCSWDVTGSPADAIVTTASACGTYTWSVNGQSYTSSGNYTFSENCQEFALNLTINHATTSTINASINEGESYSFNGQNLTTAGTYTSTLQNAAGCDSVITLNLTVNPVISAGCFAATVVDFVQGLNSTGGAVPSIRSNATQALGQPEVVVTNVVNFVSLGFGGTITVAFQTPIANGAGNDIHLDEVTWGNNPCNRYPEKADVFASQDGANFIYLGKACQDASFDLGTLSWAKYIRLVDVSDVLSFNTDADGYDLNGIECLNGSATNPTNDGLQACTLQEIVSYAPGTRKNGTAVPSPRNNANNALGDPQSNNTVNFVSLGFGGTLVAKFDYVVFNQPGNDLRVTETSFGNPNCANYPEKARVSLSLDNLNWLELGELCQDGTIEMGAMPYAQFIRIQDASPVASAKFNSLSDGYDVDAVVVLNNGCGATSARLANADNTTTPNDESGISVFPNPMEEFVTIRFDNLSEDSEFTLELFDGAGRLIQTQKIEVSADMPEFSMKASGLAHGIYQVVIHNETTRFMQRLVK